MCLNGKQGGEKQRNGRAYLSKATEGRGHGQICFVDIGELGTASAVHVQVYIHVGARENHGVNRGKLLLILSGHVPYEPDSSWMRRLTEDEVGQELWYGLCSLNTSRRQESSVRRGALQSFRSLVNNPSEPLNVTTASRDFLKPLSTFH